MKKQQQSKGGNPKEQHCPGNLWVYAGEVWVQVQVQVGGWGATPDPKQYILASCNSNVTILGTQKRVKSWYK